MFEVDRIANLAAQVYGKVPPIRPDETASEAATRGAIEILQVSTFLAGNPPPGQAAAEMRRGPRLQRQEPDGPAQIGPASFGQPERPPYVGPPKGIGVIQPLAQGQEPTTTIYGSYEYRWRDGVLEYRGVTGELVDFAPAGEDLERHYFDVVYLCFRPGGDPKGDVAPMLEAIGRAIVERMVGQLSLQPDELARFVEYAILWQQGVEAGKPIDAGEALGAMLEILQGG